MAVFTQAKHVPAPLNDRLRARLFGEFPCSASSGSGPRGASTSGDSSSLSALLNDFLESSSADDDDEDSDHNNNSEAEMDDSSIPIPMTTTLEVAGKLRDLISPPPSVDPLRSRLISDVESAAAEAGPSLTGSIFRRAVMRRLRERGHNAGICKARWDGGGGLTAGSYEYIDVVLETADGEEIRYIVDLGFSSEFEVARPTEEYGRLAAALPAVVVARPEEMRVAVRVMAEAARRSLKSSRMSVPPWRKKRYMMAKWLGFYRRTVNGLGAVVVAGEAEVRWRAVGFGRGDEN
ncbi:uncharacterized protein LOC110019066 [Phalaenopsis equestris]|uniref:uncharacterized protein LOC110019066 n=1 Tax=Phalaenopsis equestris TaxID=78828 RepID=UPI0009E32473|nr:uncharacterized protein LOC110019066 [Phalaenopsis equestris]